VVKPEIEVVLPAGNLLGEGPMWNVAERALYWVDALAPAIHRLGEEGELASWPMPRPIGSFVFRQGGGLIGALKNGFCAIDLATGASAEVVDPEPDRPDNILNDANATGGDAIGAAPATPG
jgi:L-arabinonolactonase